MLGVGRGTARLNPAPTSNQSEKLMIRTFDESIQTLLLTEAQAAKALQMSPRKLWGLRRVGQIRYVRTGHLVRYDPNDLRDWIEASKLPLTPSLN
jgi:hypothetical protein